MILAFDEVEVDLMRSRVWRDGALHPLSPRALDLIVHLVEHRSRVISLDELRAEVWDDGAVSDSTIGETLRQAREALGRRRDGSDFFESVYAHGYRFASDDVRKMWITGRDPNRVPLAEAPPSSEAPTPLDVAIRSLEAALSGHACAVLLCGRKSLEVAEAAGTAAAGRGAEVVAASCADADPSTSAIWGDIASELGIACPATPPGPGSAARWERFARALGARAARRGLVCRLDALERADEGMLRVCERVVNRPAAARVLLIGCYDEERANRERRDALLGDFIRATGARVTRAGPEA